MYAAIYIATFRLQSVLRHEPALRGQPVALVEGDATKGTILEVTDRAAVAGVAAGMACPQGVARCPGLIFKSRSPRTEEAAMKAVLQAAYAFSPYIENTAPGVCTIDMRGLGGTRNAECGMRNGGSSDLTIQPFNDSTGPSQQQFGFLEEVPRKQIPGISSAKTCDSVLANWAERLLSALDSIHLHAQLGIAATPSLALLAARAATPFAVVTEPRLFVAELPIAALDPMPDMLSLLSRWGIQRVGELLALGKENITERLGVDALDFFERASLDLVRPLNIVVPPETFEEEMQFEAHIETLEPLLFVLRRFIEQLAARIALTYRVVSELALTLKLEAGSACQKKFNVPAPTSDVETLFRMMHTHLESLRTESAIVSLHLQAFPCRAEKQQFGLFESALRDPNQFDQTLAQLHALLGPERVGTPVMENTHRPDSFRMERPEFAGGGTGESLRAGGAARAQNSRSGPVLRRFRDPIDAHVVMEQGKPAFVTSLKINGPVRASRGPWITSGEWWDRHRWSRNEWDVELRNGTLCRLFSRDGQWLLEGLYD